MGRWMKLDYYVDNDFQVNGDYEVHAAGCYWLKLAVSRTSLVY